MLARFIKNINPTLMNYANIESKVLDHGCYFIGTTSIIGAGVGAIKLPNAAYKEFKQENNKIGMYVATPIMIPFGAVGCGVCGLFAGVLSPIIATGAVLATFND